MRILIGFVPLALLAACGDGGGAADDAAASAEGPAPTALVRTAVVTIGTTSDRLAVYGAAESSSANGRSLTTQAEATVSEIRVSNGTAIGAGQIIAILRPSATAQLDTVKAQSDAAAANAALARAMRLRADGLVSDADVETARAAAKAANATRSSVATRNGTLVLRAPVAGTVQGLTVKTGDLVPAGTTVATISVSGDLRARFGVDPADAQRIRPGQPITLAPAGTGQSIETKVVGVDSTVDATTRLASVFARIPGGLGIGAGEPLRGSIALGQTSTGMTIPYAALLDDGGRSYVFVVDKGVARSRDVSPGNSAGDRIQILRGLKAGEKVVTEGGTALEDDMKVREDGAAQAAK